MRPVRGPDGLEASREVVGSHLRDDGSVASGLVPDRLRDALRSAAVDQPRRVHDVAGPCVRGAVFGFWRRRMQHVNPCAANAPQKGLAATPGLRFRIARLCPRQVVPQIGVIQDRLPCTFTFRVLAGRVDVRDVRSDDHQGVSVSSLSTAPAFERLAGCGDLGAMPGSWGAEVGRMTSAVARRSPGPLLSSSVSVSLLSRRNPGAGRSGKNRDPRSGPGRRPP